MALKKPNQMIKQKTKNSLISVLFLTSFQWDHPVAKCNLFLMLRSPSVWSIGQFGITDTWTFHNFIWIKHFWVIYHCFFNKGKVRLLYHVEPIRNLQKFPDRVTLQVSMCWGWVQRDSLLSNHCRFVNILLSIGLSPKTFLLSTYFAITI